MAAQFLSYPIAGATVSVVKDSEILLAKGYGYANMDKRTPVETDTTLFRIGSTTKLFIWTAVMQLVEAGISPQRREERKEKPENNLCVPSTLLRACAELVEVTCLCVPA